MRRIILAIALLVAAPIFGNGLRPFVRGSWQQLRNEFEGQPLIVHFWGVSCPPCVAELPMWAALRQERRDAVIVFVAADPEPVGVAAILKALAKSGLDVTGCWIFADLFTERLRYEVDPGWRGELPYTVLITRTGGISTISGVVEPKRLREWLDKHLPRR